MGFWISILLPGTWMRVVSLLSVALLLFLPPHRLEAKDPCSSGLISINQPPGIDALLENYRTKRSGLNRNARRLRFEGVGAMDVYNPTAPFEINGQRVIAARVESRNSESDYRVIFFSEKNGTWRPVPSVPLRLQDPFHTVISGEHIIGGVETFDKPGGGTGYRTVFYRGTTLQNLRRFAEGPNGMKDIRLCQLRDGRILVFTRPQGLIPGTNIDAGPGRIGVTTLSSLDDLGGHSGIFNAQLLPGLFREGEWGGVNDIILLPNGTVRALMHIARWENATSRGYYSGYFDYNPVTGETSPIQIVLERGDLAQGLNGQSKNPGLRNVIFTGGIVVHGNGWATLYVGAGDAEAHAVEIPMGNE